MSDNPGSSPRHELGQRIIGLKPSPSDDALQYVATLCQGASSHWVTWHVGSAFGAPDQRREARVSSELVQQLLSRLAEVRILLCAPPGPVQLGRHAELALDLSGLDLRVGWQQAEREWNALDDFAHGFGRWVENLVGVHSYAFR